MTLEALGQRGAGEADDAHSRPGDGWLARLHPDRDPDFVRLLGCEPVELEGRQQAHDCAGSLLAD